MRSTPFANNGSLAPIRSGTRSALAAVASAIMLIGGCGLGGGSSTRFSTGPSAAAHAQGSVHGGQQPITGATIQLYTVGISGIGSASNGLIAATITTSDGSGLMNANANPGNLNNSLPAGSFTITGMYNCASATQVYLVASGGNSGAGINTAISEMAALGSCSSLSSSNFINVNELTTIAAVYALAPFATNYAHIGATGGNPVALVNAFSTANLLVNVASGAIPTPPTGMTLPATRLNTLADILATCINSSSASSTACGTLFTATGAADTIDAALAIARNPGSSFYTALYSLPTSAAPFQPNLTAQPNDFTLAIHYTGSELMTPYGIAIDASGNAWVTNEAGKSVVKVPVPTAGFSTTSYSAGGLLAPRGISIDQTGDIWIANTGANDVVELSSSGSAMSGAGYTGGGIDGPVAIANDANGNAWVANLNGNSITELGTTGTASATSPLTGSGALKVPTSIAIDANGEALVANAGTGQLCTFTNSALLEICQGDSTLLGATAVAYGTTGAAMAGSTGGSTITGAFTGVGTNGVLNATNPVVGGGLNLPVAVAYDGNGNSWFANTGSISEFAVSTPISPSAGFGSLNSPAGIAIDAGGNVWTANSGDNSVSIFVGLATPIVTPIALNVGPAQSSSSTKPFVVYDNMHYAGKPNTSVYGLISSNILEEDNIWPNGESETTPPSRTVFDAYAAGATNPGPVVLDVELLGLTSSAKEAELAELADWATQDQPGKLVGYYGYNTLTNVATQNIPYAEQLVQHVSAMFPNMYTFDTDQAAWAKLAAQEVAEARSLAPGKPVYLYLWPEYHPGTPLAGTYVSGAYWAFELQTAYQLADGVVIWSSEDAWNTTSGWWAATLNFMQTLP